jgi:S1-C subfamily serine protease
VTFGSLRVAGAVVLCLMALSGCGLAPVTPPSQTSAAPTRTAASQLAAPAAPAPIITASGFSAYERAALRVRNIGCSSSAGVSKGSGFAITGNVFVTNRHVAEGAVLLQVSTYDGRDITVNTVGTVVVADLALVWTQESLPGTLPLASLNPPVGAEVTVVGYPEGGELTTTRGHVLRYGRDAFGESPFQMMYNDAPIKPGSSGSPLIDSSGKLVGVAYARVGGQYAAVPVETLKQVLKDPSNFSNGAGCY